MSEQPEDLAGPPRPLGLREMAQVLGGFCHVEEEAFRALGEYSTTESGDDALRLLAAGAARAHAWRAGELERLLPVSFGLPGRGELVLARTPGVAAFAAGPAGCLAGPPEEAFSRLAAWYEALAGAYELRLSHLHKSADGPVRRTLRRLLASIEDQLGEQLD